MKLNELLSFLRITESGNVDAYRDSLAKAQSPKYRQEIIKAAVAKGDKFAVRQGLMLMNKDKKLDPKEYNALLDYWSNLESGKASAGASKSKSFMSRFGF
jgi:uncharacterized membrane protein YvbJ